ncbi:hypothetical protein [Castellaniella sp. UC4442_H9]
MHSIRTVLPLPVKLLSRRVTGYQPHGHPLYAQRRWSHCAVLKLRKSAADTTVRADSSATRGHAQEVLSDAWLLVAFDDDIRVGDRLVVMGFQIKVTAVRPRLGAFGDYDHNEIKGSIESA